jgi:hypothetical protein
MTRKLLLALAVLFFAVSSTAQVQSTFFGFNWAATDTINPPHNNPWPTPIGSSFGRARIGILQPAGKLVRPRAALLLATHIRVSSIGLNSMPL